MTGLWPSDLLQHFFSGLTLGSIYAIVGLSFNIVYKAGKIINLAQGQFVVLGGLVMVSFYSGLKLPLPLAFLLTMVTVTAFALLVARAVVFPVKDAQSSTLIVITVGLAIFLEGGASLLWGKESFSLPPFSSGQPFRIARATIMPQTLWVIGGAVFVAGSLALFFSDTMLGKAIRASAANSLGARVVGISHGRVVLSTFALGAAVGALAGILITPTTLMEYNRGFLILLKAIAAVALGGLGNLPGAVIAGFIIGLAEAFAAGYISSRFKDVLALSLLLLILFTRQTGLLSRRAELD